MGDITLIHMKAARKAVLPLAIAFSVALIASASPASAAGPRENWAGASSPYFEKVPSSNELTTRVPSGGSLDGNTARLRLKARPGTGPDAGIQISTTTARQFGSYATRMKSANCAGQDHVGVVTGAFTYSGDHSDSNGNGVPDNGEIDIEWLCAQPEVVYLTIWTDYSEADESLRKVSRVIDLRAGRILSTCFSTFFGDCQSVSAAENSPSSVPAISGYDSSAEFFEYGFDWSASGVTYYLVNRGGQRVTLWDYHGPASRIPTKSAQFLQNVWHSNNWDPIGFEARNQPTADVDSYVDWTQLP